MLMLRTGLLGLFLGRGLTQNPLNDPTRDTFFPG